VGTKIYGIQDVFETILNYQRLFLNAIMFVILMIIYYFLSYFILILISLFYGLTYDELMKAFRYPYLFKNDMIPFINQNQGLS